jgi:hypothetical protein
VTLSVFTPAEHRLLAACRERAEGVGLRGALYDDDELLTSEAEERVVIAE